MPKRTTSKIRSPQKTMGNKWLLQLNQKIRNAILSNPTLLELHTGKNWINGRRILAAHHSPPKVSVSTKVVAIHGAKVATRRPPRVPRSGRVDYFALPAAEQEVVYHLQKTGQEVSYSLMRTRWLSLCSGKLWVYSTSVQAHGTPTINSCTKQYIINIS